MPRQHPKKKSALRGLLPAAPPRRWPSATRHRLPTEWATLGTVAQIDGKLGTNLAAAGSVTLGRFADPRFGSAGPNPLTWAKKSCSGSQKEALRARENKHKKYLCILFCVQNIKHNKFITCLTTLVNPYVWKRVNSAHAAIKDAPTALLRTSRTPILQSLVASLVIIGKIRPRYQWIQQDTGFVNLLLPIRWVSMVLR